MMLTFIIGADKFSKADFFLADLLDVHTHCRYSLQTLHVTEAETLSSNGIRKMIYITYKFTQIYLRKIKLYLSHSWVAF
jgi:hypothetical protein